MRCRTPLVVGERAWFFRFSALVAPVGLLRREQQFGVRRDSGGGEVVAGGREFEHRDWSHGIREEITDLEQEDVERDTEGDTQHLKDF